MTRHGETVSVRGEQYVVVGVGPASTDAKFWGKRTFTLRKLGTYDLFTVWGKQVAGNSKLTKKEGN